MSNYSVSTKCAFYLSPATRTYCSVGAGAPSAPVSAVNVTLEWDDQSVLVTDATHGVKNRYQLITEPGWQPFLLPPQFSTYGERGRIGCFAWAEGNGFPAAGKKSG
jgi:hypothetical protein